MTTTPPGPSLVLRGSRATARFTDGSDHLRWEEDGRVSRIPLAAVEDVRAVGRSVEVTLTAASTDRPPMVFAMRGASAATATAFSATVTANLPRRTPGAARSDGSELVTAEPDPATPARGTRPRRRALSIAAAVSFFAAADLVVAVSGAWQTVVPLLLVQLPTAIGMLLAVVLGRGLYDGRRLPKHGITVMAEFDHHTHRTRVYRYTDLDGVRHFHREPSGGERLELSYDPRDPARAATRPPLPAQVMMALVALIGLGLTGGGLWFTLHELVMALRG
ncbi:DUF3592 domain-containing protein [Streptomyces uncialis]|uniref:DUF3592 domain-containing protein n=1 Tax=Streptomyces uncialis TaxID=1048205 RepID=UPI0036672F41